MNEPEPTKKYEKSPSFADLDETTDRLQPSTAGFESATASRELHSFGDYDLLNEIARGGMGVVYKARQESLNRVVALKMIKSGEFANQEQVERFYKEAKAAAQLTHPGIVPVHEVGETDGQHYFTMGFVDGDSLAERLRNGPLPPKEAANYAKSIAQAVAYAHSKGVIHRDLKPGNVLITSEGTVQITDFGLAKRIEEDSELTSTGQVLGTPSYMPPEQAEGKLSEIGPPTDVYAIGATLYCMLVGRPPFHAANLIETLHQVVETDPASLSSLNRSVPQDLETLCLKCLEKKPSNRYTSADELVDELQRFLSGEPIHARPISRLERARRWCKRKPVHAMALFVVALIPIIITTAYIRQTLLIRQTAEARADAILNASPAAIPIFLSEIDRDISLVESRLRELSTFELTPQQRLRLSLALLPSDPSELDYLNDRLNDCSYEELTVVVERMDQNQGVNIVPDLWMRFHDEGGLAKEKFRAGIALASLDPESDQWTEEDYQLLAMSMLRENTLNQPAIRQSLRSVSGRLMPHVKAAFVDKGAGESVLESAANTIATFTERDFELLIGLSMIATPKQHSILFPEINEKAKSDMTIAETLIDVTKLQPENDLNEDQRVELGKRRAGAAINLVRLDKPDDALEVLRVKNDPESLTQFVHGFKARGVTVEHLFNLLNRARSVTESYAILLALGEFSVADIPVEIRSTWVEHIKGMYANDPSSGIHGASGWLLRHWGLTKEAIAIEEQEVPYGKDSEWFTLKINLAGPLGPENYSYFTFVVFPAGEYWIGSPDYEFERHTDEVVHPVRITQDFAVLDREVTRREFEGFFKFLDVSEISTGPDSAMVGPNWYDAVRFCRWLTEQSHRPESTQSYPDPRDLDKSKYPPDPSSRAHGYPRNWPIDISKHGFRLPTESEWEIACRSHSIGRYGFGCDESLLVQYCWYEVNSVRIAHTVRELRPNMRGLFDMHGNVYEWCNDWYGTYPLQLTTDPIGVTDGDLRVARGGDHAFSGRLCRTSSRSFYSPSSRSSDVGFRLTIVPSSKPWRSGTKEGSR